MKNPRKNKHMAHRQHCFQAKVDGVHTGKSFFYAFDKGWPSKLNEGFVSAICFSRICLKETKTSFFFAVGLLSLNFINIRKKTAKYCLT